MKFLPRDNSTQRFTNFSQELNAFFKQIIRVTISIITDQTQTTFILA